VKKYNSGEILLLNYPYTSYQEGKKRPALVLLDTGDEDIILARITSQKLQSPYDLEIEEWKQAKLLLPSIVRVDKLATLEKKLVERRLGKLSSRDWNKVKLLLQKMFSTL